MRADKAPHVEDAPETDLPETDEEILTPEQLAAAWAAEAPEPAGPVANLVSSLVAMALGIAGLLLSLKLGLGTPAEPRPGMWPFIVSLVVAVLSVVQVVIGRAGGKDGEKFSSYSWYAGIGFATLVGMVLLMPVVGFEIPSLLLCFVWMRWLGGERWRSATMYSILIVAAFYAIFIAALGTTIPRLF
ncbi:tripartite tricarboxylate transporter TctB family protein [Paeniglutamicibacter psychrophenolicus]|uniref:tripartite tricarboxylate transporter TctB family protein n=1 Tax=Paeniglutamicibacter psychrophenolicus TaxID=257454 RepID=UPI00277FEA71|nr:tripartite tricarboxylate transporter TctB family protein [Paeniglutamicibacter psychrophenolicus]MDQ0093092.1 putative membrane protein [Paeniglutamicibacter psychrophenolicus]